MTNHRKNGISRKDFLKNGFLSVGFLPLGNLLGQTTQAGSNAGNTPTSGDHTPGPPSTPVNDPPGGQPGRIRGSWAQRQAPHAGDITLVKDGNGCCIVTGNQEHSAVQQAALFLAKDIEKITGYCPPIEKQATPGRVNIRLVTAGNGPLPPSVDTPSFQKQWESYRVLTKDNDVWLVGSDFRGTAFAAYTLSERIGIDPLYLWSGYEPETRPTLVLKATDFLALPPVFRFRGFFHDDEDILPRPFEANDYPLRIGDVPLEWYHRYFETALRLRMNMVAPYTRVRRRMEVQECASNWGLFYTSHHYDILLSNPFGIDRFGLAEKRGAGSDWDWYKNKKGMLAYWQGGLEENKDLYTIWPVGLRGTDDHAYAFPDKTPDAEQVAVFREAIRDQVAMVQGSLPAGHPSLFHFTLYTEMLDKYTNHPSQFDLPEEVMIIWPDDNNGYMRALPPNTGKWKHGVYYHLAYFGGENTKQVASVVSPQRISEQFGKIIAAAATGFMLVNVSEMREFIMGSRQLSRICFEESTAPGMAGSGEEFIKWWVTEYFDASAQTELEKIYAAYYKLLEKPTDVVFGNTMVQEILECLHLKLTNHAFKPVSATKRDLLQQRNTAFLSLLGEIGSVSAKLDRQQRQFLFEQVTISLLFDARPTQAALQLAQALDGKDASKIWTFLDAALETLSQLEKEILLAERPPFEKWYRPTWIRRQESEYNVHRPYEQLRAFIACGGKNSPIVERVKKGHNIDASKVWASFLEESEKLPDKLL